jgi:hypothetical protein
MAFSIYDASIPPMIHMMESLSKILDKAMAQAESDKIAIDSLLEARLAPDMFPFPRQIQIATDAAKGCAARLAGKEPPSFPDEEKTLPELKHRLAKTIAFLKSIHGDACIGAEDREIVIKTPSRELHFSGRDYVNNFALPTFYFHVTTAYGLLRMKGIAIGKMDYLGG